MHVKLDVGGMTCGHCVKAVTGILSALPGAKNVSVEVGRASFDAGAPPSEDALRAALDDAGYELRSMTVTG